MTLFFRKYDFTWPRKDDWETYNYCTNKYYQRK